jgi:hypothetical protein
MNEHLNPIFESVLPALAEAEIPYWVYGGVAIAGINRGYLRTNPDVDLFVMNDDYDKTIELVVAFEKKLGWEHRPTETRRGRPKSEWLINGRELLSIVPVFPHGDRVRFDFGRDFIPQTILTTVTRRIGAYSFVTPSAEFIKELVINKVNSAKLLTTRKAKLRIDAKVVMNEEEYKRLCDRLYGAENQPHGG